MEDMEEYKLPFEFRYTVDDLTLNDYLTIYHILDEDEYPITEVNGKRVISKLPVDKEDRSEQFMFNLQQKVLKSLTNLTSKHLNEPLLVKHCMDKLLITFHNVDDKLEDFECKYETPDYNDWTFYRWILLEQRVTKGYNIMDGEEVKENIKGIYWILPMTYGTFVDNEEERLKRFEYFLHELPLKHSLKIYREQIKIIESIKKNHNSIYSNSGEGGGGLNMGNHFKVFGWMETLRTLVVDAKAFGNYKETKDAPLMEVLEFLNINSSYIKAENADMKTKHK